MKDFQGSRQSGFVSGNTGTAPPVYRPQPGASQLKQVAPPVYRPKPSAQFSQQGAPPVYVPRSATSQLRPDIKVTFPAHSGNAFSNRYPRQVVSSRGAPRSSLSVNHSAPPVYRPEPPKIMQLKPALQARPVAGIQAPPVYHAHPVTTTPVQANSSGLIHSTAPVLPPAGRMDAALRPPVRTCTSGTVQMVKYVRRGGKVYEVPDGHKTKRNERWATVEQFRTHPGGVSSERKAAMAEEARLAEERRRARLARRAILRDRKAKLAAYPKDVRRSDRDFSKTTNRHGQGKAHMVEGGLAAAGTTSIPPTEQLIQDSPNKGTSNLISFTGPNPRGGANVYGPSSAETVKVKVKKLARAKLKGKEDAANLEVLTSAGLLELAASSTDGDRLSAFIRKDDEHQVRVGSKSGSTAKTVIPKRFLVDPSGEEIHDSDSESESDDPDFNAD
jgi:hypothetical protein